MVLDLLVGQSVGLEGVESDDGVSVAILALHRLDPPDDPEHVHSLVGDGEDLSPADEDLVDPCVVLLHLLDSLVRTQLDAVEAALLVGGDDEVLGPDDRSEDALLGVGVLEGELLGEGLEAVDVLVVARGDDHVLLGHVHDGVDAEPVVGVVGSVDFEPGFELALAVLDDPFDFVLPDDVQVPGRVPDVQDEVAGLAVVEFEGGGVDGLLHLLRTEVHQHLVADIPRVHEELPPLVLP